MSLLLDLNFYIAVYFHMAAPGDLTMRVVPSTRTSSARVWSASRRTRLTIALHRAVASQSCSAGPIQSGVECTSLFKSSSSTLCLSFAASFNIALLSYDTTLNNMMESSTVDAVSFSHLSCLIFHAIYGMSAEDQSSFNKSSHSYHFAIIFGNTAAATPM